MTCSSTSSRISLLLQLFLMMVEKNDGFWYTKVGDSFPLTQCSNSINNRTLFPPPPCSNSIYNHICFPPSSVHTAVVSDGNMRCRIQMHWLGFVCSTIY